MSAVDDALLGKPFLARIHAKVGMLHGYLEIPRAGGVPIIVEGRRYLGNRHWQKVDLKQSTHCLLPQIGKEIDPHEAKNLKVNTRVDTNGANILWIEEVESNEGAYTANPTRTTVMTKYNTTRHTSVNINRQHNRGFIGNELPAKTSELIRMVNNSEVHLSSGQIVTLRDFLTLATITTTTTCLMKRSN